MLFPVQQHFAVPTGSSSQPFAGQTQSSGGSTSITSVVMVDFGTQMLGMSAGSDDGDSRARQSQLLQGAGMGIGKRALRSIASVVVPFVALAPLPSPSSSPPEPQPLLTEAEARAVFGRVFRHDKASYRAHALINGCPTGSRGGGGEGESSGSGGGGGGGESEGEGEGQGELYPQVVARLAREMHQAFLSGERPILALRPQSAHLVPAAAADPYLYIGLPPMAASFL